MHILLIGPGALARRVYLPLLTARADVRLELIAGRSEEGARRAAEQYRVPQWTVEPARQAAKRWKEAGFTAAFVHVPTGEHAAVVLPLLEAGIPVYVDKPLAYSLEEARVMVDRACQNGVPLVVGFNRRYAPQVIAARWMVPRPVFATFEKHRVEIGPYGARETLFDDYIHPLDLAVSMGAGEPEWVAGEKTVGGHLRWVTAVLPLPGGTATVSMVRGTGADAERIELIGSGAPGTGLAGNFAAPRGAAAAPSGRGADTLAGEAAGSTAGTGPVILEGLERRTWAGPEGWCSAESPPWQPIWERRGFTGTVDAFLAAVRNPAGKAWREDLELSLRSQELADTIARRLGW